MGVVGVVLVALGFLGGVDVGGEVLLVVLKEGGVGLGGGWGGEIVLGPALKRGKGGGGVGWEGLGGVGGVGFLGVGGVLGGEELLGVVGDGVEGLFGGDEGLVVLVEAAQGVGEALEFLGLEVAGVAAEVHAGVVDVVPVVLFFLAGFAGLLFGLGGELGLVLEFVALEELFEGVAGALLLVDGVGGGVGDGAGGGFSVFSWEGVVLGADGVDVVHGGGADLALEGEGEGEFFLVDLVEELLGESVGVLLFLGAGEDEGFEDGFGGGWVFFGEGFAGEEGDGLGGGVGGVWGVHGCGSVVGIGLGRGWNASIWSARVVALDSPRRHGGHGGRGGGGGWNADDADGADGDG